jgi:hypothetical protein
MQVEHDGEHDGSARMNGDKMKAASSAAGIVSSSPNEMPTEEVEKSIFNLVNDEEFPNQ